MLKIKKTNKITPTIIIVGVIEYIATRIFSEIHGVQYAKRQIDE